MMTATDKLRNLLDERGVEWKEGSPNKTKWSHDGIEYVAYNAWPRNGGATRLILCANLTPEQVIAEALENEESYTRDDVESAFVSGYSLGCLPVGSDPQWDENKQTVDEHMAELGWVRAATLGRPAWRNSYDQQRYDRWYNSLFHGEPSSFHELIEDVIWTTETVDLGPNGNECQGVDEGEVYTERLIESWAKLAATLGGRKCELHDCEGSFSALNRPVWLCDCGAFMTQYTDATTYHKPRFCPNCGRKVAE